MDEISVQRPRTEVRTTSRTNYAMNVGDVVLRLIDVELKIILLNINFADTHKEEVNSGLATHECG